MTSSFVSVAGGRLHVVDEGDRSCPPIVLLHAGVADLRSWDDLATRLVVAGYRVIRFDGRGHGRSTTEDVDFSPHADVVADIEAAEVECVVLIGNSRGGQFAFDTAIEHPHLVVAVVGVGAGLGGFDGQSTPAEMALFREMDALETAAEPDPAKIADIDVRVWVDGPGQPADRVPAAIRAKVAEMDAPLYAPGHLMGRPIPLNPAAVERLGDLRCPILAVAGELDVSDVVQTARYLAANARSARAVVLPHVAHMIGMEAPDELAALIVGFLTPLPRWS